MLTNELCSFVKRRLFCKLLRLLTISLILSQQQRGDFVQNVQIKTTTKFAHKKNNARDSTCVYFQGCLYRRPIFEEEKVMEGAQSGGDSIDILGELTVHRERGCLLMRNLRESIDRLGELRVQS